MDSIKCGLLLHIQRGPSASLSVCLLAEGTITVLEGSWMSQLEEALFLGGQILKLGRPAGR